uniref:Male-enhanced antigen 1 n=1 Tax=Haemonchus contortus TaxID=6289 RepID=A0A7I4YRN0_HAECO
MTPRREPQHNNNDGDSNDDFRAYEVDGWRVGYEVEMNGVGIVDDRDSDDGSGFPDTDPETDGELDLGDEEVPRYPGYQALSFQTEERSSENNISCDEGIDYSESTSSDDNKVNGEVTPATGSAVSYPIRKEFGKLIQESSTSANVLKDEPIPHQPNNIILDEEKIQVIRKAMSSFTLPPPPQWANLDNVKLNEIIREKITPQKSEK